MTEKLYDKDSFIKDFTAQVLECEPFGENWSVLLDKTAFFPEAGGQTADRGTLGTAAVLDVQIKDEKIYHITDLPLEKGSEVSGSLDFERRFDFMQQHSAEHILSGVAHRLFGCENVGFHLSDDIVTFDLDKPLNENQITKLEEEANQKVFENVAFSAYYPDGQTLSNLNYRSKKELDGEIRIVEIENTDMCACCAPHVKTAGQIGLIKIVSSESLRGGVRMEIKCGKRALEDYKIKQKNVAEISAKLCVKQDETADAVGRLLDKNSELKAKLMDIKRQSLLKMAEEFTPESDVTAIFETGLEVKDLQHFADTLYKNHGGIRAVFSENEAATNFAVCGEAQALDEWFKEFKNRFNVKGGGRNGMVQGSVAAEKQELEGFFSS